MLQFQTTEREKLVTYSGCSGAFFAVRNVSFVWVVGVAKQGARGRHATAPRRAGLARVGTAFFFVLIICCGGLAPLRVAH